MFSHMGGIGLLLALFVVPILCGAPSDVITSQDVARFKQLLTSSQHKNHLWGDWTQTHAATGALRRLGAQIPNSDAVCQGASKAIAKTDNLVDLYHIAATLAGADCAPVALSSSVKTLLQGALKSGDLHQIHSAVSAIFSLSSKKSIVDDYDFSETIESIVELMEVDGTFKQTSRSESGTAVNAGLALYVVGTVFKGVPHVEDKNRKHVREISENVATLMDASTVGDGFDFSKGSPWNGLVSAATVLRGLTTFAAAVSERIDLTEANMNRFASLFVTGKHVQTVSDTFALLEGLTLSSDNAVHVPLVTRVVKSDPLTVRVTNVLDQYATNVNVKLNQAFEASDSGNVVAKDSKLVATSSDKPVEYKLKDKLTSDPGFYTLQLTVDPTGGDERFKSAKIERSVKVFADLKLKEFEIAASESPKGTDIKESDNQRAAFPNALKKTVAPEAAKYVHAKIWIESSSKFVPSQVFLQLTHADKNKDAYFIAKLAPEQENLSKKAFLVKLALDSAEFTDSVYGPGDYSLSVIVGDALVSQGSTWTLGKISLKNVAATPDVKDPFAAQVDIEHTFRPEERTNKALLAFVFTIACGAPFVLLVLTLLGSGLKVHFPGGPTDFLYSAVFQGSIAAILFVYFLYWVSLNIFQALGLVSLVAVVAVISGNRALKALNHTHPHQD